MAEIKERNVLRVVADDIGWFDVGACNRGIMGGASSNIDWIARDVLRTGCYAQVSHGDIGMTGTSDWYGR